MMAKFGKQSQSRLSTCDTRLQSIFSRIVAYYDCTILEGHRSPERQAQLVAEGRSKVKVGKHNSLPSNAVDAAPWPIPEKWGEEWKERVKFYELAALVKYEAAKDGIKIRWGGDWDGDGEYRDQTFDDIVHFEIAD